MQKAKTLELSSHGKELNTLFANRSTEVLISKMCPLIPLFRKKRIKIQHMIQAKARKKMIYNL